MMGSHRPVNANQVYFKDHLQCISLILSLKIEKFYNKDEFYSDYFSKIEIFKYKEMLLFLYK